MASLIWNIGADRDLPKAFLVLHRDTDLKLRDTDPLKVWRSGWTSRQIPAIAGYSSGTGGKCRRAKNLIRRRFGTTRVSFTESSKWIAE